MFKVVVLISGSGTNLQAIIEQIRAGNIKAEIAAVISNRPNVKGLERAEKADIPTIVLDHTQFSSREAFDESLAQIIQSYEPELIVLAGFMRILSDGFVQQFDNKIINIHPSLLPKYKGLHTHKRALESGDKEHGATVHWVVPELDAGGPIVQGVVPILPDDTADTLAQRVHEIEHVIYPLAVKWIAENNQQSLTNPKPVYWQDLASY